MNFIFHPEMVHLLPVISIGAGQCACCGEDAGHLLEVGWGAWSLIFHWGGTGHA